MSRSKRILHIIKAIKNLAHENSRRNKKRNKVSFIAMTVAFSVCVSGLLFSLSYNENQNTAKRKHAGDWLIAYESLDPAILQQYQKHPSVKTFGTVSYSGEAKINENYYGPIGSFDTAMESIANLEFVEGKYPSASDEIAIDEQTLALVDPALGINDSLSINTIQENEEYTNTYTIVGIVKNAMHEWEIPALHFIGYNLPYQKQITTISVTDPFAVLEEITLTTSFEEAILNHAAYSHLSIIPSAKSDTSVVIDRSLLSLDIVNGVQIIALLAIFASMISAIKKREENIVSLRRIGMTNRQILLLLIFETSILLYKSMLLGFLLGLIIGGLGECISAFLYQVPITFRFDFKTFGVLMFANLFAVYLGLLFPYLMISNMDVQGSINIQKRRQLRKYRAPKYLHLKTLAFANLMHTKAMSIVLLLLIIACCFQTLKLATISFEQDEKKSAISKVNIYDVAIGANSYLTNKDTQIRDSISYHQGFIIPPVENIEIRSEMTKPVTFSWKGIEDSAYWKRYAFDYYEANYSPYIQPPEVYYTANGAPVLDDLTPEEKALFEDPYSATLATYGADYLFHENGFVKVLDTEDTYYQTIAEQVVTGRMPQKQGEVLVYLPHLYAYKSASQTQYVDSKYLQDMYISASEAEQLDRIYNDTLQLGDTFYLDRNLEFIDIGSEPVIQDGYELIVVGIIQEPLPTVYMEDYYRNIHSDWECLNQKGVFVTKDTYVSIYHEQHPNLYFISRTNSTEIEEVMRYVNNVCFENPDVTIFNNYQYVENNLQSSKLENTQSVLINILVFIGYLAVLSIFVRIRIINDIRTISTLRLLGMSERQMTTMYLYEILYLISVPITIFCIIGFLYIKDILIFLASPYGMPTVVISLILLSIILLVYAYPVKKIMKEDAKNTNIGIQNNKYY